MLNLTSRLSSPGKNGRNTGRAIRNRKKSSRKAKAAGINRKSRQRKRATATRKIMKGYPNVKTAIPTICICGFPNVGKSTLLAKISTAKPEIKNYAFTTKGLNLGYIKTPKQKLQLIDTPGTLNRFEKMNVIEKQAYLAIKHCADLIIYIFDLTEPYPLGAQEKLFNNLKKFNKPMIVYLSKTDVLDAEIVLSFKKHKPITDIEKLKGILLKKLT